MADDFRPTIGTTQLRPRRNAGPQRCTTHHRLSLLLTPVVFFHELGHYWVARRAGVVVEVFSVGFGPEIYGWTSRSTGTRGASRPFLWVVMCGCAAMKPGEAGGFVDRRQFCRRRAMVADRHCRRWSNCQFHSGDSVRHGLYDGRQDLSSGTDWQVMPETAAAEAGLRPGDLVTEIDGISVRDFNDMRGLVVESRACPGFHHHAGWTETVRRDTDPSFNITAIYMGVLGVKSVGAGARERLLPGSALVAATSDAFRMSVMILRGLARLGSGQMQAGEVQGPVGIAKISGSALQQGLIPFILLTAVISINLGLINLLPIPALDGGHLVFFFWEAIFGKPLPLAVQGVLLRGGIAILMGLMVVLVAFDLARLVG